MVTSSARIPVLAVASDKACTGTILRVERSPRTPPADTSAYLISPAGISTIKSLTTPKLSPSGFSTVIPRRWLKRAFWISELDLAVARGCATALAARHNIATVPGSRIVLQILITDYRLAVWPRYWGKRPAH